MIYFLWNFIIKVAQLLAAKEVPMLSCIVYIYRSASITYLDDALASCIYLWMPIFNNLSTSVNIYQLKENNLSQCYTTKIGSTY